MVRRLAGLVVLVQEGRESDETKKPAHLAGISGSQSRPRVWKSLHHVGHSAEVLADDKRRRFDQQDEGLVPGHHRTGVG